MNVYFIIVCLLFIMALAFGIYNLFFMERKIVGLDLKNPKKREKLIRKSKLTGFIFLLVAIAILIIVLL